MNRKELLLFFSGIINSFLFWLDIKGKRFNFFHKTRLLNIHNELISCQGMWKFNDWDLFELIIKVLIIRYSRLLRVSLERLFHFEASEHQNSPRSVQESRKSTKVNYLTVNVKLNRLTFPFWDNNKFLIIRPACL